MSAEREDAAKIVYAAMQELMPLGKEYPWVEGGNSNAQAEARRAAAKLPLLTPEQAAVIAAAKALRDSDDKDDNQWFTCYVELCALKSRVDTLRAQEGE